MALEQSAGLLGELSTISPQVPEPADPVPTLKLHSKGTGLAVVCRFFRNRDNNFLFLLSIIGDGEGDKVESTKAIEEDRTSDGEAGGELISPDD